MQWYPSDAPPQVPPATFSPAPLPLATQWYPTESSPQQYVPDQQWTGIPPYYVPDPQWSGGPPPVPWQQPGHPPPRRSRRGLVIGVAVGAVIALVAGGTTAYLVLRSDDEPAVVANGNVLRGSYPDAPSPDWTVTIEDVEKVAGTTFDREAQFGYALDYEGTVVASLGSYSGNDEPYLVAIDTDSGEVRWAVPSDGHQSYTCADETVDGLILCTAGTFDPTQSGTIREYSLSDGALVDTVHIDGLAGLAVADGSVYTAGWDSDSEKGWIAKGSPDDTNSAWRAEYDFGSCGKPFYGDRLSVADGVVIYSAAAVTTSGGERINAEDTISPQVSPSGITVIDCADQNTSDIHAVQLIDRQGTEIHSVRADTNWAAIDLTRGPGRPFVIGNTAYDTSGDPLWSADDDVDFSWLSGDVAVGLVKPGSDPEDFTLVAYSLTSGEKLWESPDSAYAYFDGVRAIPTSGAGDGTLTAIDLESGDDAWTIGVGPNATIDRVGNGFVATQGTTMTFYPPTD